MKAAFKSRWAGSIIILLMTFLAGLVLSPDAMPVVRGVKGLMPVSGPPLIVYSTTRWDYFDSGTYPVTMSDMRSKILDMDILNGILMRMGFTRRSDYFFYPGRVALTDIYGTTLRELPSIDRPNSSISINSTGTTIGWVENDNPFCMNLQSGEILSVDHGFAELDNISISKMLLSDSGESALTVGMRMDRSMMGLLLWDFEKTDLIRLPLGWGSENFLGGSFYYIGWELACDISSDGSMVLGVHSSETFSSNVVNLHAPDTDPVCLMKMRDADEMVFFPAFMPDGESFIYLHYDISDGETGQVELMFRDLELNSEPVLITQFSAVCDDDHHGGLKIPPAYLQVKSHSNENPEVVITGANLNPRMEPFDRPSDRYVNVVRLKGTPPELIYLGGFRTDNPHPLIGIVGDKGILAYYNSYGLVDLKTGRELGKIRFDGPYGQIICTSGY